MITDVAAFAARTAHLRDWLAPSLAEDWPNLPVTHAQGAFVYGADGKRYLDFVSGMAAGNLGHCHPRIVEAAKAQVDRLIHGPVGVLLYDSLLQASEELARVTPGNLSSFFWGNSGTEAVEGAIKLARYVSGRQAIIGFLGAFHGRTYGSATLTSSNVKYRAHYHPLLPSVYHVPYPYCFRCPYWAGEACCDDPFTALDRTLSHLVPAKEVAAIIIEPILGEGGYVVPPADFLRRLRALSHEHGILLIFDEIQTGFGRTGEMFASQTFDVTPDVLVLSKSIASGFPLSVVAASPKLMQQWTAGSHGTTFGGNAVSCAAAVATLQVLREDRVLENVRLRSKEAFSRLTELANRSAYVGDVRGKGLMIGIEFIEPSSDGGLGTGVVQRVLSACLERGLILYPAGRWGQVVRFIPPLIVTPEVLEEGLDIFADVIMSL